jgi:amidase
MGKTNVSPLLLDIQSYNDIFGTTNNPHNLERTPGGSSGGAAAALAAGMTPLEIGSDLAGSIRIPAHFCGVFGLKPTEHLVSMRGHIPDVPGKVRTHRIMWSIGPLARSIEDLDLALRIIAGPDGWDPDVPPVFIGERRHLEPKELRLAWAPSFPGVPVARTTEVALRGLANSLQSAGAVVDVALPGIDFAELARTRAYLSRGVRLALEPEGEEGPPTLAEYYTALHTRDQITRDWEAFFGKWDALLCPVAMRAAFPHCPTETPIDVDGEAVTYWRVIGHTAPFNFTGHPVVVVPVGKDEDGLPIGVQVVGKRWDEARLLSVASVVAQSQRK